MPATNGRSIHDRTEVEALKASIDLAAFIQESGVPLRVMGRNLVGLCPFHKDAEASFTVNPDRQLGECFGCQSGGDVFSFLQLREGLGFPEALARLRGAAAAYQAPARTRGESDEAALPGGFSRAELLGRVAELYAQGLRESQEAQIYLASRGLDSAELWKAFRIGTPTGSLLATLPPEGEVREALMRLGVINRAGREHFAGCIVIPLDTPTPTAPTFTRT